MQTARTKAQTQQKLENYGWNTASNSQSNFDELEDKFRRWETQDELEQLKRKMGK
jgi:hypothetical protein